jgi:hypothetical protein
LVASVTLTQAVIFNLNLIFYRQARNPLKGTGERQEINKILAFLAVNPLTSNQVRKDYD